MMGSISISLLVVIWDIMGVRSTSSLFILADFQHLSIVNINIFLQKPRFNRQIYISHNMVGNISINLLITLAH